MIGIYREGGATCDADGPVPDTAATADQGLWFTGIFRWWESGAKKYGDHPCGM